MKTEIKTVHTIQDYEFREAMAEYLSNVFSKHVCAQDVMINFDVGNQIWMDEDNHPIKCFATFTETVLMEEDYDKSWKKPKEKKRFKKVDVDNIPRELDLLSMSEAADQLKMTTVTLWRLRKKGLIKTTRVSKNGVRILQREVNRYAIEYHV